MNFASKKLNGFYADATDISAREKVLLAENNKLKRKNKRLSTAMLYLVDQIEVRLPLWSRKKSENKTPVPAPLAPAAPIALAKPPKKKIVGKAWTPEKLDYTPGVPIRPVKRSKPLRIQTIFTKKKPEDPLNEKNPLAKEQPREPRRREELSLSGDVSPFQQTSNDLSPDLAPEEISLLAIPKKDNAKEGVKSPASETFVEREAKKTTAEEASKTYLAVSMASSPVPEVQKIEDGDDISRQVALQNDMMREAMLRRVNRLRW